MTDSVHYKLGMVFRNWCLDENHRDYQLIQRSFDAFVTDKLNKLDERYIAGVALDVEVKALHYHFNLFVHSNPAFVKAMENASYHNFDFLVAILTIHLNDDLFEPYVVDRFGMLFKCVDEGDHVYRVTGERYER